MTYSCSDTTNQINNQIYQRNIPSSELQPSINCRPVSTKYAFYPIVDLRKRVKYPLKRYPTYNGSNTFYPTNDTAPWNGFAQNVNQESELRNQVYALQKSDQAVYVPSSQSDLYKSYLPVRQTEVDRSLLFKREHFTPFNPNTHKFKTDGFNNCTRLSVKNVGI
jgi:hypothetical protein